MKSVFQNALQRLNHFTIKKITESGITALKKDLNNLKSNFSRHWRLRNYDSTNLMRHHPTYFEQFVISPEYFVQPCQTSPLRKRGRPSKSLEELCERRQNQAATQIAEDSEHCIYVLLKAVQTASHRKGCKFLKQLIKIVIDNVDNAEELLSKISTQKPIKMTPDEALNLLIDNSLSKNTYQNLRVEMKSRNANILPTYFEVSQAKKKCRPNEIQPSDVKASTSIRSLSCHTISRIVLLEEDQIVNYMKKVNKSVIDAETIFAYGADGTTGQIEYHQASSSGSVIDDHSLFTVTMTPLQLRSKLDGEILWKNPSPQTIEHVIKNLAPYQTKLEKSCKLLYYRCSFRL